MRTQVYSARYEFESGRKPRGQGGWAFHPNFLVDATSTEIFWFRGSYGEAKKAAVKHFTALEVTAIEVLS